MSSNEDLKFLYFNFFHQFNKAKKFYKNEYNEGLGLPVSNLKKYTRMCG